MKKYLLLPLALLCLTHAFAVDVYKWKDQNGVVHYGDDPNAAGKGASTVKGAASAAPADQGTAGQGGQGQAAASGQGQAAPTGPVSFGGFSAVTIGLCARYAREASNNDRDYNPKASGDMYTSMQKIETTCPGVGFSCVTFPDLPGKNHCDPVPRKSQPMAVLHKWYRPCKPNCDEQMKVK